MKTPRKNEISNVIQRNFYMNKLVSLIVPPVLFLNPQSK